ncbi:hypothetical protein DBV08_30690 [Rhodococcus sp. KBW08]|uniref:hypothetical protein n=1 Tax=Rhodococcus sp. KBW08 TaxID=2144188 RepID=UPI000F59E85E|nr:hypothetical protein [Rhodococcus sp. KBW08]RQO41140.1 hypothetical protein DBV08_30690 [Rhodococcus sp. KBW08]
MAVRLEPNEHAAWSAALAVSPWRSLAHWCREIVNDALSRSLTAPDSATELADIPSSEAAHFAHLCAQLNERARGSNRLGRVVADSLSSAQFVADLARTLLPVVEERKVPSSDSDQLRTKLVNVRLTDDEFDAWTSASKRAGYARVSTWVRHTVAALIGYTISPVPLTVPTGLEEVRKNLAGAVTNLAQLSDVAENYDAVLAQKFADIHVQIVDLLRRYHALGRRT